MVPTDTDDTDSMEVEKDRKEQNMNTFNDLVFKPKTNGCGGTQAKLNFNNGYGVSVITGFGAYGGDEGLYELAVLKNDHLCYSTDITYDVEGHLTAADVTSIMARVEKLQPKKT
jgi:hypothetical protein